MDDVVIKVLNDFLDFLSADLVSDCNLEAVVLNPSNLIFVNFGYVFEPSLS